MSILDTIEENEVIKYKAKSGTIYVARADTKPLRVDRFRFKTWTIVSTKDGRNIGDTNTNWTGLNTGIGHLCTPATAHEISILEEREWSQLGKKFETPNRSVDEYEIF
jgi:hypothetical protein